MAAALGATLGAGGAAGSVHAETLQDALASAYAYNTDMAAARAHLQAIDEQVPQALSGWRPTVTLNSSGGYQSFNTGTSYLLPYEFSYEQGEYGGNIQLKQPLYSGGGTQASIARAKENVRAGRADLLGTEQTVLLRAATAYDDVLRARALLALDRDIEAQLRRKLQEITIRMQAGQLTQTDIDQAASRLSSASATRISAEGDMLAANARFVAAVGRPPQSEMLVHRLPPGLPRDAVEAIHLAEVNSPTVIASRFRMNAAQQAVTVAQATLLPSVSATAMAGIDQGQSVPTVPTKQASITVNLTVPIYQGGSAASQVRQAKATATESESQTRSSLRDARRDAEANYALWRAAADRLPEEVKQVRLAEIAYEGVRKEAALGAKSTFELLGQLQDLVTARSDEVEARYNVAINAYQLLVAIGRFTAADLRINVPLYDPAANGDALREKAFPLP